MAEQNVKKKKAAGAIAILLAATALAAGGIVHTAGVRIQHYESLEEEGYCTVLVYMDGSDLETDYAAAADDLKEMEEAAARADPDGHEIRIVVEAGGADRWQYGPMEPYEYGRFCITGEGVTGFKPMEKRDMGRSDTLADFINYGIASYPAEHYGLIFWNHGAGQTQGFGKDENFDESALSLAEIREGIDKSDLDKPFDFTGVDACLMGNIELVAALQGKTEYLVASEDLEPQDGYDYRWIETLAEKTRETEEPQETDGSQEPEFGRKAGEAMLSSYETYYQEEDINVTLALLDVNAYEEFSRCFDRIAGYLTERLDDENGTLFREMSRLRGQVSGFGASPEKNAPEQLDLIELLSRMAEQDVYPAALFEEAAEAFEQMRAGLVAQGYANPPCGLSIYLPGGIADVAYDSGIYGELPFCEAYQEFAAAYADYMAQGSSVSWNTPEYGESMLRLDVTLGQTEEIADAYSAVYAEKGGVRYLLSSDGDVTYDLSGYLSAPMEDTFWGLKGEIFCLIESYSTDSSVEYLSPVLYRKEGGQQIFCLMSLEFSSDCPDGAVTSIAPVEVSKQLYTLEEGDEVTPLYPVCGLEEGADRLPAEGTSREEEGIELYLDDYVVGTPAVMENMEAGDGEPEMVTGEKTGPLQYGFIIRDTGMNLWYTEPAEIRISDGP